MNLVLARTAQVDLGDVGLLEEEAAQGDPAALDFIAYYVRDNRAVAACSIGRNPAFTAFLHLLGEGRVPAPDRIEAGADLAALV